MVATNAQQRAKKNILDTFIKMLEKTSLSNITVEQITIAAKINRSTFYRYYRDKQDLLEEAIHVSISSMFNENMRALTNEEFIRQSILVIKKQERLIRNLTINNNSELYPILVEIVANEIIKLPNEIERKDDIRNQFYNPVLKSAQSEYISYMLAGGVVGIFYKWIDNGMEQNAEEIIKVLISLINFNKSNTK
ncbi:TetR/AcrR family transcriptional regulator [Dellaglioa sp. BT-FLS60]